jgi:uncharacterized RDD family membrane protein YckC
MSTTPGWYDDPAPGSAPGSLRWWDGRRWTDQTRPGQVRLTKPVPAASRTPVPAPPPSAGGYQQPGYQQPGYQQPGYQQPGYQGPVAAPVPPVPLTHTPDGAALASPGKRLGAALLDALFVTVVSVAMVVVFVLVVFGGGALAGAFEPTASDEPPPAFIAVLVLAYVGLLVASILFGIWYYVLRVRKVGATYGKQVLGLRVRTFGTDGQLTWAQAWGRYGIPTLVNGVVGVTFFVDSLWLLWDKHRQTLHDKLVGTVVVDTSLPRLPLDHPAVQYARSFPAARGWLADGPNPQTPQSYPR